MQTLNEYLQSTQTLNQTVPEAKLTFYVSKDKLLALDDDSKKKKVAIDQQDTSQYMQVDVELESLRADISYKLRQKHYTDAVRALINMLDQASIELEDGDGGKFAERIGMGEYANQFARNLDNEYATMKAPERIEKMFKRMDQRRIEEHIIAKEGDLVAEQRRRVMMNIYRKRYSIPDDLMVRKPDLDIRMAVQDSMAIKKLRNMIETGLHPSIIFFEKNMDEEKIQKVVQLFDANPQTLNIYQEINAILTGGSPQICLMFHPRKNQYLIKKVAGFIHVPYNFKAKQLKEYAEEHINSVRDHAREYVKSQKTKSRIDQVLAKARGQL